MTESNAFRRFQQKQQDFNALAGEIRKIGAAPGDWELRGDDLYAGDVLCTRVHSLLLQYAARNWPALSLAPLEMAHEEAQAALAEAERELQEAASGARTTLAELGGRTTGSDGQ